MKNAAGWAEVGVCQVLFWCFPELGLPKALLWIGAKVWIAWNWEQYTLRETPLGKNLSKNRACLGVRAGEPGLRSGQIGKGREETMVCSAPRNSC